MSSNDSTTTELSTTASSTTLLPITTTATSSLPSPTTTSSNDPDNKGAIIGGVLGAVAGVAIVVLVIFFIIRRYRRRKNGKKERPSLPDLRPPPINETPSGVPPVIDTTYETQDEKTVNPSRLAPRSSLDDLPQVPPISLKPVTPLIGKAFSEQQINKPPRQEPRSTRVSLPYIDMIPAPVAHKTNTGYVNEKPKKPANYSATPKESDNELSSSNGKHTKVPTPSEGPLEDYIDMQNLPKHNIAVEAAVKKDKVKKDNNTDENDPKNYVNLTNKPGEAVSFSDNSSDELVLSESNSIKDSSDEEKQEDYINVENVVVTQHLNEISKNIAEATNSKNNSPETNHKASHTNDDKSPKDYINVGNLVITPPEEAKKPTLKHSKSSSTSKQENNSPQNTNKKAPATLPKPKANPAVENKAPSVEIPNDVKGLVENGASEQTIIEDDDDGIYINSGEKIANIPEHLKSLNTLKDTSPKSSLGVHKPPQKPQVSPKPTRPKV